MARNVVLRHHAGHARQAAARGALELERPAPEPAGDDDTSLWDAWQQLSETDREVLALVAWEELPVADAARVLGGIVTPQLPPTLARVARANPVRPDDDLGLMPEAQAALDRILATEAPARRRSAARRSRRVVIVALATLLLVAVGAGLAATDPFGIFRNPNPGSALYGVDSSRHVKPPTAYWIQCPQTTGNAFRCGAALSGTRYELLDHVESNDASVLTRANLKTAIRQARARGEISAAMAKRFDQDLAAVSDTFLARFRTMFRYQQLGVGLTRVPPAGVLAVIVCEPAGRNLSCQDLNGDANAAVGSGIYLAVPEPNWRAAPPQQPDNGWALEVAILGGPPSAADIRLEEDLLMAATTSSAATSGQAQRVPPPPQSR